MTISAMDYFKDMVNTTNDLKNNGHMDAMAQQTILEKMFDQISSQSVRVEARALLHRTVAATATTTDPKEPPTPSRKRKHEEAAKTATSDCIPGLTSDMVEMVAGSYKSCNSPEPISRKQGDCGQVSFVWMVQGSSGGDKWSVEISVPPIWNASDQPRKIENLEVECNCPDAERQAQRNAMRSSSQYCKHVVACLRTVVDKEAEDVEGDGQLSFDQRLYLYNDDVGSNIQFETFTKTGRGKPCESCFKRFEPGDPVYVNEGRGSRFKLCKPCVLLRFKNPDPEDDIGNEEDGWLR